MGTCETLNRRQQMLGVYLGICVFHEVPHHFLTSKPAVADEILNTLKYHTFFLVATCRSYTPVFCLCMYVFMHVYMYIKI
jgi:hypothetical protein